MDDFFEYILPFIMGIACTVLFIFFAWLIYNYCTLEEFKYCYDINFKDIKCTKYKNY